MLCQDMVTLSSEMGNRALDLLLANRDVTDDVLVPHAAWFFVAVIWRGWVDMENRTFVNRILSSKMARDHASEISDIFDQSARLPMFMKGILRLAHDVAGRHSDDAGDMWRWARKKHDIEGLLRRLA